MRTNSSDLKLYKSFMASFAFYGNYAYFKTNIED